MCWVHGDRRASGGASLGPGDAPERLRGVRGNLREEVIKLRDTLEQKTARARLLAIVVSGARHRVYRVCMLVLCGWAGE